MPHYSILTGFDTKPLKLGTSCTHYAARIIAVVSEDLQYESNVTTLAVASG